MATTVDQNQIDRALELMAAEVEGELPKFAAELRDRQGKRPAKAWTDQLDKLLDKEATDDTDEFVLRQCRSLTADFSVPADSRNKDLPYYMKMRRGAIVRKRREAQQPKSPTVDLDGLDDLTVKELRELAHRPELKIEVPAKARKRDLIDAIAEAAS